jgi:hypothetical protein
LTLSSVLCLFVVFLLPLFILGFICHLLGTKDYVVVVSNGHLHVHSISTKATRSVLLRLNKHCTNTLYNRFMMVVQPGRPLSLSKPTAQQVLLMSLAQHSVKLMNSLKVHRFKSPITYYSIL